jgi:hypothetical protein
VWGTANGDDNIVWGTDCGGDDCDNVVWGTADGDDNIVWGTANGDDNIVWGTAKGDDTNVWGTANGDDNIVWGTALGDDSIVWGTANGDDNIVWGTALNTSTTWTAATLASLGQISASTFMKMTDDQVFAAIVAFASPPDLAPPPTILGTVTSILKAITIGRSGVLVGAF